MNGAGRSPRSGGVDPSPRVRAGRPRAPFTVVLGGLVVLVAAVLGIREVSDDDGSERHAPGVRPSASSPLSPVSASPREPLPRCRFGDARAEHLPYDEWQLTLVDTRFRLPPSYQPPDLVPVRGAGFSEPFLVRPFLIDDLRAMREAAAAAGNPVSVVAGYRSFAQQESLFNRRAASQGELEARTKTARPGHSEHQLGIAVDFKSAGELDVDQRWARSFAGLWVAQHAWEYGFVTSYPKGAEDLTCYAYEPWHYRYVGREMAAEIHESGATLRELLWESQAA